MLPPKFCAKSGCQVSENLTGLHVTERRLRRWFSEALIMPEGRRGLALQGATETAGLPNAVVIALENHHLIRAETRGGSRWYELSHDRLVEPIVQSNRGWEAGQDQAHPWRPVARQWKTAQSETLLYRGKELAEAQTWLAGASADEVEGYERSFIEASGEAERARRRRQRLYAIGGIVAFALILVMAALTWTAVNSRHEADWKTLNAIENQVLALKANSEAARSAATAKTERARTHISQLVAQALAFQNRQYDLALLLSVEAYTRAPDNFHARNSLLDTLQYSPRLAAFLQGHKGYVGSVAFSPDGKILASGSGDNTVVLWDVATRQQLQQFPVPHGYVASVAFSPDGRMLASGSQDGTVILWDRIAFATLVDKPLGKHEKAVLSVTFSPDGKTLATGGWDGTVMLWDIASRQLVGEFTHTASVASVAFSPGGKTLAAGSLDNTITLWDVVTGEPLGEPLTGHTGPVLSVAFARYGNVLASGSWDGNIILWDVSNLRDATQSAALAGHKGAVLSVVFSGDGKKLASASSDNTILLWDVGTRKSIEAPLVGHSNWVRSVAFSPDGNTLASGCYDKSVILWDISAQPSGAESLSDAMPLVKSITFSQDGALLAAGGGDNKIILWNVTAREKPLASPVGHGDKAFVTSLVFAQDGKTLVSGGTDTNVILWDVSTPAAAKIITTCVAHKDSVTSVAYRSDGQILATGDVSGTIILWNVSALRATALITTLTGYQGMAVNSMDFASDGRTLAAAMGKEIILWDVSNLPTVQRITTLTEHYAPVVSVVFAPDGKKLASGSWDNTIILWDVSNPQTPQALIPQLTGHQNRVLSVAFTPDGKTLASGSTDNTIILWDIATQQRLGQPLTGHSGAVESVAFSPDGRTLASGSLNKQLFLWDVAFDAWADRACAIANRNLMPIERAYFTEADNEQDAPCGSPSPKKENLLNLDRLAEDYLISENILQATRVFTGDITLPSNASVTERQLADFWNREDGQIRDVLIKNADRRDIEPAAAVAFVMVQSSGQSFGADGRMTIRFENHIFWQFWGRHNAEQYNEHFKFNEAQNWTGHLWRSSAQDPWRSFHGDHLSEWQVFEFARTLDETAAMQSISMGGPQIMGFNYASMSYTSVQKMFDAWRSAETAQLDGLFQFVDSNDRLVTALQNKDFMAFAQIYNGAGQAETYGTLMQQFYDTFKALLQRQ